MGETKVHRVALTSKEPPHAVDDLYKYVGEDLPKGGPTPSTSRASSVAASFGPA